MATNAIVHYRVYIIVLVFACVLLTRSSLHVSVVTEVDTTPNIIDLYPRLGPFAGGSLITLNGTNLNPSYPAIGALFNDTSGGCPALYGFAQLNLR